LKKYNTKRKKNIKAISGQAMKALVEYDWPGNVRELENAVERAVVLAENDVVKSSDLLYYGLSVEPYSKSDMNKTQRLVDVEREYIVKTLEMFSGHKGKTAKALGIDRKTLRTKLKKYGIGQE
jgi:DNA-binding NtrC family response regulator